MENKIEINAIMKSDSIKIIATFINAKNDLITIHDEEISSFDKSREDVKKSLRNIIKSIEEKTSRKIEKINLIFDDFMKKSEYLKIVEKIKEEKFDCENDSRIFTKSDFKNIFKNMIEKAKEKEKNLQLISVIPFRFIYLEHDKIDEIDSDSFPTNKRLSKIRIFFSVRYMNKENYKKSIDFFDSLDIKINLVALNSQISIYDYNDQNVFENRTNFTLSIKENRTLLISSVNNIAIKTDVLDFSLNNLIRKISVDFEISEQEAKDLIICYNKIVSEEDKNSSEIIYSSRSSSKKDFKIITRKDISDVTKSFLKSICKQANEIINKKIINNVSKLNELKIVGELSMIENVTNYCSKYFDKVKVLNLDLKNETIYDWNSSYVCVKNYIQYFKNVNNKINPETFYYNNNEIIDVNKSLHDEMVLESKINSEVLLA